MPSRRLISAAAAAALALVASVTVSSPALAGSDHGGSGGHQSGTPGAAGAGDPFFPLEGNGGYDVAKYSLRLSWAPDTNTLTGFERIDATTTQSLSSFNLDLRIQNVLSVRVNGRPAKFTSDGVQELTVTPAQPLRDNRRFVVTLQYSDVPPVVTDPDGSAEGWVRTTDGVFVVGEPQGSPAWFAVNDSPGDKARFDVSMTVPDGLTAVGNGLLASQRSRHGQTTFRWIERQPMAPYLATISIGDFDVTRGRTPGGIPTYVAVDPSQAAASAPVLAKLPDIVDYYAGVFGRYPFSIVGAIVDDAPDVGYALETQTKPIFDQAPDESTLAHEIAHQWFGDAVTLTQWPDIWLNEGFATWSEWLWNEHTGGTTTKAAFDDLLAQPADDPFWTSPPAAVPGPADMFSGTVYDRGAMTLEALKEKIGDDTFATLLRTWYRENRYGNVTTADFIATSERVSGQQLDDFFQAWLYAPVKPAVW